MDSSVTSCRKTLEGIVHKLSPDSQGTLFQRLEELVSTNQMLQPLVHLTTQIRKGGNIGAHFDEEIEPTEEFAALMLDLLEYFMEYAFLLPARTKQLEEQLDKYNNSGGTT